MTIHIGFHKLSKISSETTCGARLQISIEEKETPFIHPVHVAVSAMIVLFLSALSSISVCEMPMPFLIP